MPKLPIALVLLITSLLLLSSVLAFGIAPRTTETVLYDGSDTTLPADEGFAFVSFPGEATQTWADGGVVLDTSASTAIFAGYFGLREEVPKLDRQVGFTLTFTMTLLAETHNNENRAGFSVILLTDDDGGREPAQGIELAFWSDEVWVQDDGRQGGGLFTHGEGASYDTSRPARYDLSIVGDRYSLRADGRLLLHGPVRDYNAFAGLPDPYEQPNFLFLGDDSSSASGRVKLDGVALTTTPADIWSRVSALRLLAE